ncbi:hypothetical protein [Bacillus pseudomycoides]|nr:hypothetical protein [Bacillus pseudomycoides]
MVERYGIAMFDKGKNQTNDIIFSYDVKKDDKVLIYWYDKLIKVLSGENAKKFLYKIEGADDAESQLIMAKLTRNLKRGKDENTNTIVIRGTHYTRNRN